MGLNKCKGNMYGFVTHTFNTIKGECWHNCSYCYMKRFGKQSPIHFDKKELKTNLGENNTIFVGSSNDMWAEQIPQRWIIDTIDFLHLYRKNKYVFQSKNPQRFIDIIEYMDRDINEEININAIFGTVS